MLNIRPITAADKTRWQTLWSGYLDFYGKSDLPDAVTDNTWSMIADARDDVFALVAETEAGVIGFVNCVAHPNTWNDRPICYLEDLYVDPDHRGNGAGRALMEAVIERAKSVGWGRVYWRTHAGNADAHVLYEKLTPKSDWVVYEIEL